MNSKAPVFDWQSNRAKNERELLREFFALVPHEPKLLVLLTDIMAAQPTTDEWYLRDWKERVSTLVGWDRDKDSPLGSSAAYDTVYELCASYCYDDAQP
jgi:hypothetical protein